MARPAVPPAGGAGTREPEPVGPQSSGGSGSGATDDAVVVAQATSRATASRLQVEIDRVNRTVHAVPASSQMKLEKALSLFNNSEAPQRVSGIARSLGAPIIAVVPSATEGSIVSVVVAWELCWYRYEVDLAEGQSGVRVVAQGTELSELPSTEQTPNAATNDRGELVMAA